MSPILWALYWLAEAVLIVALLVLLEWLRARRGRGTSTEFRIGVYRDDPPIDDDEQGNG